MEELFRDFNKFDFSGVDFGDILKTFNECKDIFNSIDFKLTLEDFKKTLKTISIVLILVEIAKGSISARIPFSYIFKSYPTLFSTAFPGMTISSVSAMFSTFLASNVSFPTALVSVTLYNFLVCGIIPVSCVCICAALIIENKDSFYRTAAFLGKTYDIFSKIYNNENLRKIFDTVWDNRSTFKKVYDCGNKIKDFIKESRESQKEEEKKKLEEERRKKEEEENERIRKKEEEERRKREEERRKRERDIREKRCCPRCYSYNIYRRSTGDRVAESIFAGLLSFGIGAYHYSKKYRCRNCSLWFN